MLTSPRLHQHDMRFGGPAICATLIHVVLLFSLLRTPHGTITPMRLPGTSAGSHLSLTYSPGQPPSTPAPPVARRTPVDRNSAAIHLRTPVQQQQTPSTTATATSSPPDATNGNDALGTGNVNIALAATFPTPKPDLSSLPSGTSGDVVLDIVIDASGKVASIAVSRGLGHGIDETVIATVQQWSFHPATRDGQPVSSEQELHFHYEKA